jgi:hypothetical protein
MQLAKLQGDYGIKEQQIESGVRQGAEQEAEDKKSERIKEQAIAQSKLISQRKGDRGELNESDLNSDDIVDLILKG